MNLITTIEIEEVETDVTVTFENTMSGIEITSVIDENGHEVTILTKKEYEALEAECTEYYADWSAEKIRDGKYSVNY